MVIESLAIDRWIGGGGGGSTVRQLSGQSVKCPFVSSAAVLHPLHWIYINRWMDGNRNSPKWRKGRGGGVAVATGDCNDWLTDRAGCPSIHWFMCLRRNESLTTTTRTMTTAGMDKRSLDEMRWWLKGFDVALTLMRWRPRINCDVTDQDCPGYWLEIDRTSNGI